MAPKILIIDDDKFTREILSKILKRDKLTARYTPIILEASNGKEGLRIFEEERPTLVIVDLFMPKLDGFEVCRRLREFAGPQDLTIAVTSGVYKDASISSQIEDENQATFFAKPYQLKHIAQFAAKAIAPAGALLNSDSPTPLASQGSLEESGAAVLFWDMMEREATGRLVLRRGQVVRQIELYVGHPVSVTTNVRDETLGHFLASRNTISGEVHKEAMSLAAKSNRRLGEALIELGALTPKELLAQLTAQSRLKLSRALRWTEGSWTFRPGTPRNTRNNALDFAEVIVTGLAASAQVDSTSPALKAIRDAPLTLTSRGHSVLAQIGVSFSPNFVNLFQEGMKLDELLRVGVNRMELYACLDILLTCSGITAGFNTAVPAPINDERSEPMHLSVLADSSPRAAQGGELYSSLFESQVNPTATTGSGALAKLDPQALSPDGAEGTTAPTDADAGPPLQEGRAQSQDEQQFDEDSVVSVSFSTIKKTAAEAPTEEAEAAREAVLAEFLRIQETTLYDVLKLEPHSNPSEAEVQASFEQLRAEFDKDQFSATDLGRDFQKLEFLHATYQHAAEVLGDIAARSQYDDSLEMITAEVPNQPSMNAELHFREAEVLIGRNEFTLAADELMQAVAISPDEAAYHASLGWAVFLRDGRSASASDSARTHINQALALDPESGVVHEYKGLIHAHLADDAAAAIVHLSKALHENPRRGAALAAVEKLMLGRSEFRELEKLYRRLIFQLGESAAEETAVIWSRLGDLHAHYINSHESALIAYEAALKLVPGHASLTSKLAQLKSGGLSEFFRECENLVGRWQESPSNNEPIASLFALALSTGHSDASFLAASALVTSGQASDEAQQWYGRHRLRFVVRAQRMVDAKRWEMLLHPSDYPLVGALYARLSPLIQQIAPVKGAIEELERADALAETAIPHSFREVRDYVARVLEVPVPRIYSRSDYERMINVAATETPVLLAGYEILTSSDKLELAFRLGRAMSYLRPGRTIAAGTQARVLKSAMLACYSLKSPGAALPDPDGNLEAFRSALGKLDAATQYQLQEVVAHISQEHSQLNLSHWTRNLARTADRAGLLLCGDLPLSMRCAGELGDSNAPAHLLAFCVSPSHIMLRRAMGLSVDV